MSYAMFTGPQPGIRTDVYEARTGQIHKVHRPVGGDDRQGPLFECRFGDDNLAGRLTERLDEGAFGLNCDIENSELARWIIEAIAT